jgi:ABC-2 type transport system permease protein
MIILTLLKKELLEQWRTKKILIISIVFLFIAVSSPIIAKLTPELLKNISVPGLTINLPEPTYKDSVDQFIKNISQIGLLVLIFVVAGAVSDEKNRKTLEILLTKPVSRAKFIWSKFASYFVSLAVIYFVSSAIFYLYTVTTFSAFNFWNFLAMDVNVFAYILMIVSITILASTVVKNSIAAGGIGFIVYILFGTIFGLIEPIKQLSPNTIFDNYKKVIENSWSNELFWPLVVIVSVIALAIIAAILLFRRQEIER